jgi:hypothetical protein
MRISFKFLWGPWPPPVYMWLRHYTWRCHYRSNKHMACLNKISQILILAICFLPSMPLISRWRFPSRLNAFQSCSNENAHIQNLKIKNQKFTFFRLIAYELHRALFTCTIIFLNFIISLISLLLLLLLFCIFLMHEGYTLSFLICSLQQ